MKIKVDLVMKVNLIPLLITILIYSNQKFKKNRKQIKCVQVHKINVKDLFNKNYQRILKIQRKKLILK